MEKKVESKDDLLDLVFSWSFIDILNNNLFKNKVHKILDNFSSPSDYLSSYVHPLIEETRQSLCSGLEVVGKAPACEISLIGPCKITSKPPKRKRFRCQMHTKRVTEFMSMNGHYEPLPGDLFLLTTFSLEGIHNLNISEDQFVICSLKKRDAFSVLHISFFKDIGPVLRRASKVYATYLDNLTTNMRIWQVLNPDLKTANFSIIQKVLQYDSDVDEDCSVCVSQENPTVLSLIGSHKLDEPQENAVLSCVSMRKCRHEFTNAKLIWGPPGTGKTRTVASLLFALLKLKCTTLTCTPTNIAVLQVAERLMGHVLASLDHDTYGLGDIVLYGNNDRMKIDEHDTLKDIFLDYRVDILSSSIMNWNVRLGTMISILEHPRRLYNEYVMKEKKWIKERKKSEKGKKKINDEQESKEEKLMTFEEFFETQFYRLVITSGLVQETSTLTCQHVLYP